MTIDEQIAVLQAAKNGKVIQVKGKLPTDSWCDRTQPDLPFNFANYIYRVKPEPREWWLLKYPSAGIAVYDSKSSAASSMGASTGIIEMIHVREVLD